MCGRYALGTPDDDLTELFDLPEVPSLEPRDNIAPTQPVAVVRLAEARGCATSNAALGSDSLLVPGPGYGGPDDQRPL